MFFAKLRSAKYFWGKKMKNQLKAVVLTVGMLAAGQASATTWNLAGSTPSADVTTTAYSNTGGANNSTSTASNAATQTIETANWLGQSQGYGGIANNDGYYTNPNTGVTTRGSGCPSGSNLTYCDNLDAIGGTPEHAIDNAQRYDMALLNFGASVVKLSSVNLSWIQSDSDLTVLAFTGAGAFNENTMLKGLTYDKLTSNGWTVVGNTVGSSSTYTQAINGAGVASSYWLIGAFNPLVSSAGASMSGGFDYVKLSSVVGTTCPPGSTGGTGGCGSNKAPEPGSLALMGVGLLGLLRLRKRR